MSLLFVGNALAQISAKTEYIGNSEFYDAVADTNTGNGLRCECYGTPFYASS